MKFLKKKTDEEIMSEVLENNEVGTEEKTQKPKKKRFINKAKMKYGTYAISISAIVIAVAVGVNVLFGVLGKRTNLDIDISLKGANTLTEENIEFLKALDVDVTLTVCASKENYINYLDSYTGSYFGVSESGSVYYEQTVRFLELYEFYSDRITVEYIDMQDPEFAEIASKYGSSGWYYGDIIVSASHNVNGQTVERDVIVNYDEIYNLSDPYSSYYGYSTGYYVVSGNYFEKSVSSAIRKVASTDTKKVGVFETHCAPATVSYYQTTLELNNFDIELISDDIIDEIPDDYSMLIISAPSEDFAVEELDVISDWLYNNGERGRGLMYFASVASPDLPNLEGFLQEWGIVVGEGVLFDTDDRTHPADDPMTMVFTNSTDSNTVVDAVVDGVSQFAIGSAVPLSTISTPKANTTVYTPINSTSQIVAAAPLGSGINWEPSSEDELTERPGVIVSVEEEYSNNEAFSSYVVAFASYSFISEDMYSSYRQNNMKAALNTANLITGVEDDGFYFSMKSIESESYMVSENSANIISIIFRWTIPALLVLVGIVIFVRRIRR